MNGKDKIYLNIKVQPRARKPGLEKVSSREYKIRVSAPPSKGEANREVVKALASHFGLPPSRVKIVRGQKSKSKLVLLDVENSI
ncbi:MAG: YggU family protein [Candidatus Aminicenantes bacterium]|nr:YggU family protein [Candidatus Aminicenantes bacterium]